MGFRFSNGKKSWFQISSSVRDNSYFVSRSNGWHHPFEIFRSPFEWLVSFVWNFFLCFSNGWHHPFKIFPAPFKRLQYPFEILPWPFERYLNHFERLEHPFLIHLLTVHQPFVLTVKRISVTFSREWSHFVSLVFLCILSTQPHTCCLQ